MNIVSSNVCAHDDVTCCFRCASKFTFHWLHSSRSLSPLRIKMTLIPGSYCPWELSGRESSLNRSWYFAQTWFVSTNSRIIWDFASASQNLTLKFYFYCEVLFVSAVPIHHKRLGLYFQEMNKPAGESWPSEEAASSRPVEWADPSLWVIKGILNMQLVTESRLSLDTVSLFFFKLNLVLFT